MLSNYSVRLWCLAGANNQPVLNFFSRAALIKYSQMKISRLLIALTLLFPITLVAQQPTTDAQIQQLIAAAKKGDLAEIQALIDKGGDVNGRTSEGLMPFLAARIWGRKEAADMLVKNGADTNAPLPAPEALVDKLLSERIDKDGAGAAILVARNGKILFEKGYGLADIEHHVPVTADTIFRIGSVTKQFTASAILRLQEAGRLKVTDLLSKYYPDFPRSNEVTLRHLLTHTSGIKDCSVMPEFLLNITKFTSPADLIASISKAPYDFNPGLRWSYSNSGYVILGSIIEKVSGQQYEDFLRTTFFAPLGMKNSGEYRNLAPPSGAAIGYGYAGTGFKKAPDGDMSRTFGSGIIYSTVKDLYLWNEAVFGYKVLSKETIEDACTPVITEENKNDKPDGGYGYGWEIKHFRGVRGISHGGVVDGFLSSLLRLPEQGLTVVVLANACPAKPKTEPERLSREIAEMYVGAELPPVPAPVAAISVSKESLAAIVGHYDYQPHIRSITQEGDHVYAQLGSQKKFEIFPKSETEFFFKAVDAQIIFVKDASGKVIEVIQHQGGHTIHAPRLNDIIEVTLTDAQTEPLLGDYDFKSFGKMTISRENGRLYSKLADQPKLELGAVSATELFPRVVNARFTFGKDADGKVIKLILHQGGQNYEMPKLVQP